MIESSQYRRTFVICLCLAAAIAAVYSPVRHFGFTNYDDGEYIAKNAHVQSGLTLRGMVWAFTTNHAGNWHPLTWLSHMLDWQLWRGKAGAHHLVNVLLHVANTLLLFGVLRRMTAAPWRSALVAGLFALHPLHVESVAWVAECKDVLSTCFWILTMWAYVCYVEQPNGRRYWLALGLYTLGLMAKPMVVTLPFVLLLLDYWPLGRTRWTKSAIGERVEVPLSHLLREKVPFVALATASCVATIWAQRSGGAIISLGTLPFGIRMVNAVVSYVRYMGKMFWPAGLAAFYPYQVWPLWAVLGAGVVLLGVSGVVIWRARREPYFLVGWLWYVGTLVPVIGLAQVGSQSMADRYTYIPLVGLLIMMAWGVPREAVEQRMGRVVAATTAVGLLVVCGVLSWFQIHYWKDSETLFRHTLNVTEDNFVAHNNLGYTLFGQKQVAAAIAEYTTALRIDPNYAEAHYNLGDALASQGKLAEAAAEYMAALQVKPDYADAHYGLGNALAGQGNLAEAIAEYTAALRIDPGHVEAHNNLGLALAGQGRLAEAAAEYQAALRIQPDLAAAHNNLGNILTGEGRLAQATAEYQAALRIQPDYVEAYYNLGNALAGQGMFAEAAAEYQAALRINPEYAEAHNNLGIALASLGEVTEAIAEYTAALRVKPDFAEVRCNLGGVLAARGQTREAIAQYREALRLRPEWPPALSKLAWILATDRNASLRNGAEAVQSAERLCEITGYRQDDALDALAAAYAEVGRFNDAIQVAQKAVELANAAGQGDLVGHIQERLKLYQAGSPYREGPAPVP